MNIGFPNITQNEPIPIFTQLNSLNQYINVETSEEGLKDIAIKLTDVFGRIINTFKTNLLKFHKTLKRSELRAYMEAHILQTKVIEGTDYTVFRDVLIPTPNGMNSTYLKVIEDLNIAYQMSDIMGLSKAIMSIVEDLSTALHKGNELSLTDPTRMLSTRGKKIQIVSDKLHSNFSDKHTTDVIFSSVFKSMSELNDGIQLLLSMENRLQDVAPMLVVLDKIDNYTSKIITLIADDTNNVSKPFIQELSSFIHATAVIFEVYGTYIETQMALEHNLTYVMKNLYIKCSK